MFTAIAFKSILPEVLILVLGLLVITVEPFWKEQRRRNLGWLTAAGLAIVMIVSLIYGRPGDPTSTFGTTIRFDWLGFFFKMLFLLGAAITALLLMDHEQVGRRGEAYLLMLASTIGMCLMASAGDLVMLYLAIESTSIPLYILAGFMVNDDRSTEAGFKYLLYGATTSAIMLYGFSLLFGFAGTTDLYALAAGLQSSGAAAGGHPGRDPDDHRGHWIQGVHGPAALLGAGRVRGRSDADRRVPFHGLEGCRVRGPGAAVHRGLPGRAGSHGDQLDSHPGGAIGRHDDGGEPAGPAAAEPQAAAGVLVDRARGLRA